MNFDTYFRFNATSIYSIKVIYIRLFFSFHFFTMTFMAPVLHLKADSERLAGTCVHGDRVTGGSSSKVDHAVFRSRGAHRGAVRSSPVVPMFWVHGTQWGLAGGGGVRVAGVCLTLLTS